MNQTKRYRGKCTEIRKLQVKYDRQGCIHSPLIFNIYSECIFRETFEQAESDIVLNGERINNIKYAEDKVVFAASGEGL